jgi:phosphate starvation-inducible PhoH-like protein
VFLIFSFRHLVKIIVFIHIYKNGGTFITNLISKLDPSAIYILDTSGYGHQTYKEICDDLFGRGDGYGILKMKKIIEFTTTSFLRGMTFNNAIVIVDETNNMNMSELDTVMTRLGNNSRIIFCGDYRQTDLNKPHEKTGIREFMNITKRIDSFIHVEYQKEEIVRSGVVRDYIITKTEMGL